MYDPEAKTMLIDGLALFAFVMVLFTVARLIVVFLI